MSLKRNIGKVSMLSKLEHSVSTNLNTRLCRMKFPNLNERDYGISLHNFLFSTLWLANSLFMFYPSGQNRQKKQSVALYFEC